MSDKTFRHKILVNRRLKPPHPSPSSTSKHRRKVVVQQSSNKHLKVIKRWNSEPSLMTRGISIAGSRVSDDHRDMTPPGESCVLFTTRVSNDAFASSPELLLPNSLDRNEGYNKDAKVVVKVMVEGSVGPIRTLVKLGSSVDETIKLVMNKYNAEGRSPRLNQDAKTSFELHHSYYSLQCLDKSNMIGDIGSRSFYMRKSVNDNEDICSNTSIDSETFVVKEDDSPSSSCNIFFSGFIYHEFKNMIKRTRRIWRFLGCFGG